jgi:hypothetical protein
MKFFEAACKAIQSAPTNPFHQDSYYYQIKARNGIWESAGSNVVRVEVIN